MRSTRCACRPSTNMRARRAASSLSMRAGAALGALQCRRRRRRRARQRLRRRRQAYRRQARQAARRSSITGSIGVRSTVCCRSRTNMALNGSSRSTALKDLGRPRQGEAASAVLQPRSRFRDRTISSSSASRTFSATAWCAARSRRKRARGLHLRSRRPGRRIDRRPRRTRHRPLRRPADHRGGRRAACLPRAALCR